MLRLSKERWMWNLLYNSENSAPGEPEPGLFSLRVPPLLPQGIKIQNKTFREIYYLVFILT
jgi:hypothetical protein